MAVYLNKQRRWSPKRLLQFALAIGALLLAIAVMVAWMLITHHQSNPPSPSDSSIDASQYVEPITAVDHCLLILDFSQSKRFVLIQTDPAHNRITTVAVPANLADKNGTPLTELLKKHGSLRVIQTVSAALELPVDHYITFNDVSAQSFLSELDHGITYTLPENIQYTDENGATIRLSAGEQKLTGAQAAAVLKHQEWNHTIIKETVAVDLTNAILNQYLLPERRLDGYFAALANGAQTDLRIDNFNAFRHVLSHLADSNTGTLCRPATLIGKSENDVFLPDKEAMRKENILYR